MSACRRFEKCEISSINFKREILTFLKYKDVLIYSPKNEYFGIVPVEAMYMSCIVLSCNFGGPTELIVNGRTGFLLDTDDVGSGERNEMRFIRINQINYWTL